MKGINDGNKLLMHNEKENLIFSIIHEQIDSVWNANILIYF